ncbi:MAG: metal-binding protein [Desulfuromonadales bacterium C00003093]|nr:MAG: metal-binding protein [Desulfuromonadales bacterium C00003093]
MPKNLSHCALCGIPMAERACKTTPGKAPAVCPTCNYDRLKAETLHVYEDRELKEFARQASIQEAHGYTNRDKDYSQLKPVKPRIEEIIEFAQKMNYRHLGLAFCVGLRNEAKIVEQLLLQRGFQVSSVICKIGNVDKNEIGLADDEKIVINTPESMCNPVFQARALNEEKTEFNIVIGLCVGHDSIFFQQSAAPCTVFAVKDRLLGHNPLAAIYTLDSYYRSLKG